VHFVKNEALDGTLKMVLVFFFTVKPSRNQLLVFWAILAPLPVSFAARELRTSRIRFEFLLE
jgi:hypothetical protein